METPETNGKGIRDETIDEEHLMSVWSKFAIQCVCVCVCKKSSF